MEVRAQIDDRAVYMAGETISCTVVLKNPNAGPESGTKNLAWLSAQIHCQCQFDDALLRAPPNNGTREESSDLLKQRPHLQTTSFVPTKGETGMCSMSTEAIVLACDVRLEPGEKKTYVYTDVVPFDSPPSYRGHMVMYSYKLTVGAQRINGSTKMLKIPFRVLCIPEHALLPRAVASANPYSCQEEDVDSVTLAFHRIMSIASQRSARTLSVACHRGTVVRCLPMKDSYRLGEEVSFTLDFSTGTVVCQQVSVTVQCEENIPQECWANHARIQPAVKSYSKRHNFCLHTKRLHFNLPIPLSATPSFTTNIVIFSWKLHFEFLLCVKSASMTSIPVQRATRSHTPTRALPPASPLRMPDELRLGNSETPTETLSWDFPINVLPSHPSHVAVLAGRPPSQSVIL